MFSIKTLHDGDHHDFLIKETTRIAENSPKCTRTEQLDLVYKQLWFLEQKDLQQLVVSSNDFDWRSMDDIQYFGILGLSNDSVSDLVTANLMLFDSDGIVLNIAKSNLVIKNTTNANSPSPKSEKLHFQKIALLESVLTKARHKFPNLTIQFLFVITPDSELDYSQHIGIACDIPIIGIPNGQVTKTHKFDLETSYDYAAKFCDSIRKFKIFCQ